MDGWKEYVSAAGESRIISLLGVLIVAMAGVRVVLWEGGNPLSALVATDLLIILPGLVLVYGGYRLRDTDLHPDAHPRIVSRTFAGIGVMLGLVVVLLLGTGLNRPVFTPMVATALGGAGGFAIGLNEARALSRAKEAEEARREVEQRKEELRRERNLRARIVETSPVGIAVVEPDGSISFANEHAADIVGVPEEEFTDLRYDEPMFTVNDEEQPGPESLFEHVVETGDPVYKAQRRIRRPDGKPRWLSVNATPLYNDPDDLQSVVFAFEDVTDQIEYERRLEESNERLEQFAYAASHDLQEPLRMISTYLQLLETEYRDELDEDAEDFIDFAVDGADRMRAMIESLLEYSRVTTGGDPLESTDTEAVLEDVLDDLHLRIEEADATITTDELPTVTADADQLAQVFQNLLSNAIRYSGDDPPEIHVGAERVDGAWQFSVTDEGVGIDPEYHDRIFEVFERLPAGEEDTASGAGGVGLALCERIVQRHGGDIWVESEPGEGTAFYFTIPDADQAEPASAARSPASE